MISLLIAFAVLIAGYFLYGRVTDRIFASDDRQTPAVANNDGVDCVPMKTWKAFLVQLLNIAGTGPIFGALMGAVFGPVVFLWIVFGSILGGAVHDYMSGMISERHGGASIAEFSGLYLGNVVKWIMRVFSVVLLVLCGTVFVTSPAALLARLTPGWMNGTFWAIVILAYYLLATLLPIDKLIGKLYPVFGVLLIVMAGAVLGGILFSGGRYGIPELTLKNLHPEGTPVWPYMFITVACGAVSGFHATQSPMVAKCITSEKVGRKVFYGAMISESVIALVWAAAGVAFYGTTQLLNEALAGGASNVVYEISTGVLGAFGGVLAIAGVVVCPITSGDTAFRSARLILAETFHLEQKKIKNRLLVTIPLLITGGLLTWFATANGNGFQTVWRYFSWSNQTLAMIALWVATAYLVQKGKYRFGSLLTAIPAAFMSAVSMTYILTAKEGLRLPVGLAYWLGGAFAVVLFGIYCALWARSGKYGKVNYNEKQNTRKGEKTMDSIPGKNTKKKALYGAAVAALILTVVALIGAMFSAVCLRLGFEAALMAAVCVVAVIAGAVAFLLSIVALITGIAKHSAGTWVCGLLCMVVSAGSVLFCLLRLVGYLFYDMPIL